MQFPVPAQSAEQSGPRAKIHPDAAHAVHVIYTADVRPQTVRAHAVGEEQQRALLVDGERIENFAVDAAAPVKVFQFAL